MEADKLLFRHGLEKYIWERKKMKGIKKLVLSLKQEYGTNDPFRICENLDITVLFVELPEQIKGFYSNLIGSKFIYINNMIMGREQDVVCAHELGHALLHENINTIFIEKHTQLCRMRYEKEADYFCVCLLIDDELFDYETSGLSTLDQISKYTGLEKRLVRMKIDNLSNMQKNA
jgi:Zn-dependent peptidase ImmA (M78 family)